jgi:glycerol kinase
VAKPFLLALDEGTSSARASVWDQDARSRGFGQVALRARYPAPGWVEQDPMEIWQAEWRAILAALRRARTDFARLEGIAITNQRETAVAWDGRSGLPVGPAIGWQDRRTAKFTAYLRREKQGFIRRRTGLVPDPYFTGPKLRWMLTSDSRARRLARNGRLRVGTVDSWLLWKLTGGRVHATDVSNASRTMLFDIARRSWDPELIDLMGVPAAVLPQVLPSGHYFGETDPATTRVPVPILGVIGDQQASLLGHAALKPGNTKCTYGTGCFVLSNAGSEIPASGRLISTIAWQLGNSPVTYASEGSVFVAGDVFRWLQQSIGLVPSMAVAERWARSVPDTRSVYFVPALAGLGAPEWDPLARGTVSGLTAGTSRAHLVRAAFEAIAYQVRDVVRHLSHAETLLQEIRADGAGAQSDFLLQFQADVAGVRVARAAALETASLGAAFLAGLGAGVWHVDDLPRLVGRRRVFQPRLGKRERAALCAGWQRTVRAARAIGTPPLASQPR